VLLGTGTPNADPERAGPAVAVVVHGHAYLVDAGPGVVRRAAAALRAGVAAAHALGWREAYDYRFESPDRRIVISGDTRASDAGARACDGCDVLVHEVYAEEGFARLSPEWRRYHVEAHTSAVALVLYHGRPWSATAEAILREVRAGFDGPVVHASDLEGY
jgi:ribonuclease Z